MRSAFLQRPPNRLANGVVFAAQSGIPEAKHFDAARLQPGVTLHIFGLLSGRAVLEAVQFDVQPGFQTKEIQDVGPKWMLPAKFMACKIPVP